tara:strand:- start:142 stop:639 length:498 start_codon:yes stop_codon:yes gene_type:complete
MPNHCYNKVEVYGSGNDTEETRAQIAKIKDIFEDESIFTHFIPEPDWPNIPLMFKEDTTDKGIGTRYGNLGELPVKREDPFQRYVFQSTGITDQRWYDWRLQHWDTKWDAYDVDVDDCDEDHLIITFNTAWSPPEAICHAMRELYPDLAVTWFYDEPGMEIAGYL